MTQKYIAMNQIGLLLASFLLYAAVGSAEEPGTQDPVDKATVATMTIKGALVETAGQPGLFGELAPNLARLVARLDRAAEDEKVSAVVLRIRSPLIGRGKLAELRAAIGRLREQGKRVTAQMESAQTTDFLLAAACDEIVMPESGMLMIPGVRAEVTFYKGLFDKVGVQADMMQVGDYKGAAEPYTRQTMSPAFRKQYQRLVDDLYEQLVQTISADRELPEKKVQELVDVGVFTPRDAQQAGLIDFVAYEDELDDHLMKKLAVEEVDWVREFGKKKVDNDFSGMLGMMKLFEMMMGVDSSRRASGNKKIAIVYATGMIMPGKSASSLMGVEMLGSDTIVKAIRHADQDDKVVGIVLRVDSPGGSSLASDLIWRAIKKCRKPTIASMGDTAASGGYYISMGCDQVMAEPGTLTGSIGVVGGKFSMGGLFDKVGVSTETISRGKNSGVLTVDQPFSDSERKVFRRTMESVYQQFVSKAAEGRNLDLQQLEELAGGRVWTGRQAQKNGLVDELGTLADAVVAMKRRASIPANEKVEIMALPRPTSFFDQLMQGDVQFSGDLALPDLPVRLKQQWRTAALLSRMLAEPVLFLMPYQVQIR